MKAFLETNKIYFEIFQSFFLGLMGIIFSVTQCQTSNNELAIHKSEILPLIRVDYELLKTESNNYYDTKILRISNEGKPLRNLKFEAKTFYKFELTLRGQYSKKLIYVPISNFYNTRFHTNNFDKLLIEAVGKGNNNKYSEVYDKCMKLTQNGNYIFVDEISLIKISYDDINNENHIEYYQDEFKITDNIYNEIITESKKIFNDKSFKQEEITEEFLSGLINKREELK